MSDTKVEQNPLGDRLPPETVAALLENALQARRSGNVPGARALLRVLSAQAPDTPRVWLALALVAETRAEQRRALERVIALDPHNPLAQRGLSRIGAAAPRGAADTPSVVETPQGPPIAAPAPAETDQAGATLAPAATGIPEERAQGIRWPLYVVAGAALLILLLATLLLRPAWLLGPRQAAAATPTLAGPILGAATGVVPTLASASPGATGAPGSALAVLPTATRAATPTSRPAVPTASPTATLTPTPQPSPTPGLTPGEVLKQGPWHAVLIRSSDAVRLDGSIGAYQPRGRFLLVLVAVGNDGPAPALIPRDLFAVVGRGGARYLPQPPISTAYLDTYGRGLRGDLSLEDPIPPDGSNKSIPLIFDVPEGARDLALVFGRSPKGWTLGQ